MRVRITEALRTALANIGQNSAQLVRDFGDWKSLGPAGEYSSEIFGKDGAYRAPSVGGVVYKLRHVHLIPLLDRPKRRRWLEKFRVRGRKTSNRVLVYAEDGRGNYLLIFILNEPSAHDIAEMRTARDRETMKGFAAVAEAFLHDGTVLG
jgi:hypothetical protein